MSGWLIEIKKFIANPISENEDDLILDNDNSKMEPSADSYYPNLSTQPAGPG